MEDTITAWNFSGAGSPTPLLIYSSVAEQFGLTNGSKITEPTVYHQVIDANTEQSRAACSIEAGATGEECISCGS